MNKESNKSNDAQLRSRMSENQLKQAKVFLIDDIESMCCSVEPVEKNSETLSEDSSKSKESKKKKKALNSEPERVRTN